MNYIVLDFEWNQPLSQVRKITYPVLLSGEIIQFGAVKLDETFELVDTFDVTVKPVFYTKMNKHVSELTLITDDEISHGTDFENAVEQFEAWCGTDSVILTWGPDDIRVLKENLFHHGLGYSWIPEHYDAQLMFDDLILMEGRQRPLNYALYYFDIKTYGAHDALNDAKSTAMVLREMGIEDVCAWIDEEREYANCG